MERKATGHFTSENRSFITPDGREHTFQDGCGPYEYLMGALSGCFYSTLASFPHEGTWEEVEITAKGVKRESVPTTLERTSLEIIGKGISDKEEFGLLVRKAAEACSIYNTIKAVSEMDIVIRYEEEE